MEKICARWGLWTPPDARGRPSGGVILMSHSAGSIPHGWRESLRDAHVQFVDDHQPVIKDCPTLAKRSAFVDPVVFCLWEGDVCYNFCYRDPKTVRPSATRGAALTGKGARAATVLFHRRRNRDRTLYPTRECMHCPPR
jgi:hypothetical protein